MTDYLNHHIDDADTADRDFWRGYNRRKHVYWMDAREEQREAAWDEACRREPAMVPLTGRRVLPVIR